MKITIMGLGLNGGGLASALYFAKRGDDVTVTDLRDETILAPAMERLKEYPIRYILKEHRIEDFRDADCVIKNPAVKWDSPYLKAAKNIETDITVFKTDKKSRYSRHRQQGKIDDSLGFTSYSEGMRKKSPSRR